LVAALLAGAPASAQLQHGAVSGVVLDDSGLVVPRASIELTDPLGAVLRSTTTDANGRFAIGQLAPGRYAIRASLVAFRTVTHAVEITSAIPSDIELRLSVQGISEVVVEYGGQRDSPAMRASIGGASLSRVAVRAIAKGVQEAVATLPGWSSEDNGLLHVRGTDDGFLYVIDGVPVYERLDQLSGLGPDLSSLESISVITGYVPAEFGYKAGGVIDVRSKPAGTDWSGSAQVARGSDDDTSAAASGGGPLSARLSLTVAAAAQQSARFLDPIHPDGLHNQGDVAGGTAQLKWVGSDAYLVTVSAGGGRSAFDVPNTAEQEDAGQDQRQNVSQAHGSVSWQHGWSRSAYSQVSAYVRGSSVRLLGSPRDTPLHAAADRSLERVGVAAALSRRIGPNELKAGFEAQRLTLKEEFQFFVTDDAAAEEAGFSDAAIAFGARRPFQFSDRAAPALWSAFVQDEWQGAGLTVSAGLRFDASRLLMSRRQLSPRVGAAYRINNTVLRGSVSRFFQPPQPENLLLSSSPQAQQLSPFAADGEAGGADVEPERQWAYEVGVEQRLGAMLRADVAVWYRSVRDVADPNVFAGTTIIFPNAVAQAGARGLDARLELIPHLSWSGYANLALGHVRQTGPITGGLFLENEVAQFGEGVQFTPDHDQRLVAGAGLTWTHARSGGAISTTVRHESGTPLEIDEDDEEELRQQPGAELADFDKGRVKPRTIVSMQAAWPLLRRGPNGLDVQASLFNVFDARYAYNFGNPFSGTHFGAPRTATLALRVRF
jgi:outer membrane receptor for ferrienterochelin and colicin